jgi:hypothetical protein
MALGAVSQHEIEILEEPHSADANPQANALLDVSVEHALTRALAKHGVAETTRKAIVTELRTLGKLGETDKVAEMETAGRRGSAYLQTTGSFTLHGFSAGTASNRAGNSESEMLGDGTPARDAVANKLVVKAGKINKQLIDTISRASKAKKKKQLHTCGNPKVAKWCTLRELEHFRTYYGDKAQYAGNHEKLNFRRGMHYARTCSVAAKENGRRVCTERAKERQLGGGCFPAFISAKHEPMHHKNKGPHITGCNVRDYMCSGKCYDQRKQQCACMDGVQVPLLSTDVGVHHLETVSFVIYRVVTVLMGILCPTKKSRTTQLREGSAFFFKRRKKARAKVAKRNRERGALTTNTERAKAMGRMVKKAVRHKGIFSKLKKKVLRVTGRSKVYKNIKSLLSKKLLDNDKLLGRLGLPIRLIVKKLFGKNIIDDSICPSVLLFRGTALSKPRISKTKDENGRNPLISTWHCKPGHLCGGGKGCAVEFRIWFSQCSTKCCGAGRYVSSVKGTITKGDIATCADWAGPLDNVIRGLVMSVFRIGRIVSEQFHPTLSSNRRSKAAGSAGRL